MINQITSIEQSQRLLGLGVSAEKASCRWESWGSNTLSDDKVVWVWSDPDLKIGFNDSTDCNNYKVIPAFTIADLLGLLPYEIDIKNNLLPMFPGLKMDMLGSTLFKLQIRKIDPLWAVEYVSFGSEKIDGLFEESKRGVNLIGPLCDMVEWILSNNYKLNA